MKDMRKVTKKVTNKPVNKPINNIDFDDELEVEVHYGGQPIYYYFVSVE